jgi:hypothetical protein
VHIVHTFGVELGRTGAGSGRTPHVSGSSQCLQGLECGSSPTSGTVFPQVRGGFGASDPVYRVHTPLRGVFMTLCWSRRIYRWTFLWPGAPFLEHGDFLPCCYFIARQGRSDMTCFELGEWDRGGLFSLFLVSCMFMVVVVGYRMTKELIRLISPGTNLWLSAPAAPRPCGPHQ